MQPTEITAEHIEAAAAALGAGHPFRMDIEGFGGIRTLVVAPFYDTQEVMVAVSGGGCAFLSSTDRHNRFIFVQYGFQMPHAVAAEALLNGVADLATKQSEAPAPAQITDQSTSKE
jgi:hypothetical protein